MDKKALEEIFESNKSDILDALGELLKIESISTDPAYDGECTKCANWLVDHLNQIGLKASLLETGTKPVVFAEYEGVQDAPVVCFYGHYDVQPVDPLDLWETNPFEPTLKEGRLYARGAQDNKGQLFYVIKAIEALIKNDALNCTLKVVLEGEEECGSGGISAAMPQWKDKLKSDILLVCDCATRAAGVATITMGLRGVAGCALSLKGPDKDLHSGMHGGAAPNPAQGMADLLASLHDEQGKVAVDGFYDLVATIAQEDRKLANRYFLDHEVYEKLVGVKPCGGEQDYTLAERTGFRPTLEVNGICSGYNGPGMKTIIPSLAQAKISMRLVKDQDPARILDLLKAHLAKHTPQGLELEISECEIGGPALCLSTDSDLVKQVQAVLHTVTEREVEFMWMGASIPVVAGLAEVCEALPLLIGFGLEEDNIHAPNESFAIEQFRQGFLFAGLFLASL